MEIRKFSGGDVLAAALARFVADALANRIRRDGKAVLAVSGGRTPTRFFEILATERLPWSDVIVTLVDERWVDETSPRSNAALVRKHLLQGKAAGARFLPLWRDTATPDESIEALEADISDLPAPIAAVVLGMGDDGHTASFFPGGDRLADAVNPACKAQVIPMRAPGAGEPRITLTLPVLLKADRIALHIEGTTKQDVLETALGGDDVMALPVRSVLKSDRDVTIFWSP